MNDVTDRVDDDVVAQLRAWADELVAAVPDADAELAVAARPTPDRAPRWWVAAAAVTIIASGVGLAIVTGRSSDQLVTSPSSSVPPAIGGPSTTVPTNVGFEVLAVESTGERAGSLRAALTAGELDVLWTQVGLAGHAPTVEFDRSVVVGFTVDGYACAPTLVGFDVTGNGVLAPELIAAGATETGVGCGDLSDRWTFVVAVDSAGISDGFVLRPPAGADGQRTRDHALKVTPGATESHTDTEATPVDEARAALVAAVSASGRFEPSDSPYARAVSEVLGAPVHEVSAATHAARVELARDCLVDDGFTLTAASDRWLRLTPIPDGHADAAIERLTWAHQHPDPTADQPELPDAAIACWNHAQQRVADPVIEIYSQLPTVAASGPEATAAEQRYRDCLAAAGYAWEPGASYDDALFDQTVDIERAVQRGDLDVDTAIEQLQTIAAAERHAPTRSCAEAYEATIDQLIAVREQAHLDDDPDVLTPPGALDTMMSALQPYLDARQP